VLSVVLSHNTIISQPSLLAAADIVGSVPLGETPLVGSHHFLTPGEFKLGTTQSLNDMGSIFVLSPDGDDDLTDGNTGSHLHGLTIGATHARGQTIGTRARKHLVLTDNVERVATSTDVVSVLAGVLQQVLVASNTGGLKGAGCDLLLLVRDKMGHKGEHIYSGSLGTAVEDSDLGIGDTTAEPRLDVRLVLLKAAATRRSYKRNMIVVKG
jgi:hypothetical protein